MNERATKSRAKLKNIPKRRNIKVNGSVASVKSDSTHHGRVKQKPKNSYYSCDKKNFRWSLELLHTAVCGHRWDEAFLLLPCVITQTASHLPVEFLWRVTDVITRNVSGITVAERKKFWSLLHSMKLKTSMFLDILSQDLAQATDRDADELLQMIEDIQNQKQHVITENGARINKRFKALSDGYVGLIHYIRWKSSASSLHSVSSSQPLDDESHMTSFCESQETSNSSKELARRAHWFLKKALSGLDEPCEWFMLQFLELERELYGQDSAISVVERYKSDPQRAPSHHLAYHFYKNLVPGSTEEQLTELECISKETPDDPLVVEQVNLYLHSLEHGGPVLERAMAWTNSADSDSGLDDSEDPLSPAPTEATCTLKSRGKVEVLYKCVMLLVAVLDYPDHVWDLQPWQKLTEVLCKFYQAWVRCWSCTFCRSTRKRIHRLAGTVVPLWKHYVWKDPPATLSFEQARVLFHHVFAAYILGYSEDYISRSLSALQANGHMSLKEELTSLINFPGPFLKNFTATVRKNRKRLECISLRNLSQTVSESEKVKLQRQKQARNTAETTTNNLQEKGKGDLSDAECEYEIEPLCLTPFKGSSNTNILNEECGLSPKSLSDIFDSSCDEDFLTSTQTKDVKVNIQNKIHLVDDPELNGSYVTCKKTNGNVSNKSSTASSTIEKGIECSPQSKTKNHRNTLSTSTRKDFDGNAELIETEDANQDSSKSNPGEDDGNIPVKTRSRTGETNKLSNAKTSTPQHVDPLMRTRLSRRRIYQPPNKANTTPKGKTRVDAGQNSSLTEKTCTVSGLARRLNNSRSASDDGHSNDGQEETAHEVVSAAAVSPRKRVIKPGIQNTTDGNCAGSPGKIKLLFDEPSSAKQDDDTVTVESSVRDDSEDGNSCRSLSSVDNTRDTRRYRRLSEERKNKPKYGTSSGDQGKGNNEGMRRSDENCRKDQNNKRKDDRSDKNSTKGEENNDPKHSLKNRLNTSGGKENFTPRYNTRSVSQSIGKDKREDLNVSPSVHGRRSAGNKDSQRTPKGIRCEKELEKGIRNRILARETQSQSYDIACDGDTQVVQETQSQTAMRNDAHTEERHTNHLQQDSDKTDRGKQKEAAQEEVKSKGQGKASDRGKQNKTAQEEMKSNSQGNDVCDTGKQIETPQEEAKSKNQRNNADNFTSECSQSPFLTAGQTERECASPDDETEPGSQCGQGFFMTQVKESEEFLLSLVGKELQSGGHETACVDIHDINLYELNGLDVEELDSNPFTNMADQHYDESIEKENSSEVHESNESDETLDGLAEPQSTYQSPKKESYATTHIKNLTSAAFNQEEYAGQVSDCEIDIKEDEGMELDENYTRKNDSLVAVEDGMQTQVKSSKSEQGSPTKAEFTFENVEDFEDEKASGSKSGSSPQKSLGSKSGSSPQKTGSKSGSSPQKTGSKSGSSPQKTGSNSGSSPQKTGSKSGSSPQKTGSKSGSSPQKTGSNSGSSPQKTGSKSGSSPQKASGSNSGSSPQKTGSKSGSSPQKTGSKSGFSPQKASGLKSSPQKMLDQKTQLPLKTSESEKNSMQKEHNAEGKSSINTPLQHKKRTSISKFERTWQTMDRQQETPAARHPHTPWYMSCLEDLPTPSMQDIVKHSDSSTPNTSKKQRHGAAFTSSSITINPENKYRSPITSRSQVSLYPASWLEDLPLPGMGKNTSMKTDRKVEVHEATHESSDDVLSDDALEKKMEKSSRKKKRKLKDTEPRDSPTESIEELIDSLLRDWTDGSPLDSEDGEAGLTPSSEANNTSLLTTEEHVMTSDNHQSKKGNDVHASVIDGMEDSPPHHKDRHASLETSPKRDNSSVNEVDENILKNSEHSEERDIQCASDTDWMKDLPLPNEDREEGLQTSPKRNSSPVNIINKNVLKNVDQHSEERDNNQCALYTDWMKDLPLPNEDREEGLKTSHEKSDTLILKTKKSVVTSKKKQSKRRSNYSATVMDWTKDLPLHDENKQSDVKILSPEDITSVHKVKDPTMITNKHQSRSKSNKRASVMDWTKDLPLYDENKQSDLETSSPEDITSSHKVKDPSVITSKHQFNSESNRRASLIEWTKDLPLHDENKQSDMETSEEEDITSVHKVKDPTLISKHQSRSKRDRRASLIEWTKDLPLRDENKQSDLEISVHKVKDPTMITSKHQSRRKSNKRTSLIEWTKDLPLHDENKQSDLETSSPEDITSSHRVKDPSVITSKHQSRSKRDRRASLIEWTKDLPLHDENKHSDLETSEEEDITSVHKVKDPTLISKHQSRSKSNRRTSLIEWTKDLPLHDENKHSDLETSSPEDITSVHKVKDPTMITNKHHFRNKSNRRASLIEWTKDLPLPNENVLSGSQRLPEGDNTSQVNNSALSSNIHQSVEGERNRDDLFNAATGEEGNQAGPSGINSEMYGDELEGETHARRESDEGNETPSKKCETANRTSASAPNTDGSEERENSKNEKETHTVDVINKKPKKRKKKFAESLPNDITNEKEYLKENTKETDEINKKKKKRKRSESPSDHNTDERENLKDNRRKTDAINKKPKKKKKKSPESPLNHNKVTDSGFINTTAEEENVDQEESIIGKGDNPRGSTLTPLRKHSRGTEENNRGDARHEVHEADTRGRNKDKNTGNTRQEKSERRTRSSNRRNVGNIRYEEYEGETMGSSSTSEEDPGPKRSAKQEKTAPYTVETVWHSDANLTVKTARRRDTGSGKRELDQYSGKPPSKRQKMETDSSRRSRELENTSDRNFSITVCNEIERLSNICITLSRSPEKVDGTSVDKGIKVKVQFTDRSDPRSVTQDGSQLWTPVAGHSRSGGLKRGQMKAEHVISTPTPQRTPQNARKRKLFEEH